MRRRHADSGAPLDMCLHTLVHVRVVYCPPSGTASLSIHAVSSAYNRLHKTIHPLQQTLSVLYLSDRPPVNGDGSTVHSYRLPSSHGKCRTLPY